MGFVVVWHQSYDDLSASEAIRYIMGNIIIQIANNDDINNTANHEKYVYLISYTARGHHPT